MPLIKGLDQPVRDFLADLPIAATAGICCVSDPRGIADVRGKRYAFLAIPTSGTAFTLYRVDLETRAISPLAAPPAAGGGGTYNTSLMAGLYDASGGAASDRPTLYFMVGMTGANRVQWLTYDINTDAWGAVLALPTCGPAGASDLATSICLCHPCALLGNFVALNANIDEDYIYAVGDGGQWGAAGPSRVAQYRKSTNTWAYLTGAGGARPGAPAAGSKAVWLPNYPNRIYSTRGGASTVFDYYSFTTFAWGVAVNPLPFMVLGAGTEITTLYETPGFIAVRPSSNPNMIFSMELGGARFELVAAIDGVDGTIHESNALLAWWIAGQYFLGVIPHSKSEIQRIQIPMPL